MKPLVVLLSMSLSAGWLVAQDPPSNVKPDGEPKASRPSLFPAGYLNAEALKTALKKVAAENSKVVRVTSLAKTEKGRDVWLATIGRSDADSKPGRPAILIVANLEADHVVGSQVALGLIERLASIAGKDPEIGKLLDACTFYIVPRLNPDGVEQFLGEPRSEFRTNLRALDRDRDGRSGEDGPDDANGDGFVTRMRVKDEKATLLVADEKEPRVLRRADPNKGERGVYSEYSEGIDDDRDGKINEDPVGGVNLNRNWPHRWTEFDPEAGFSPASEPEVRALIQFAFDHPEIAAVWSLSLNESLKNPPGNLDGADAPLFAEISRIYNKAIAPKKKDAEKPKESTTPKEEPKKNAGEEKGKGSDQEKDAPKGEASKPAEPKGESIGPVATLLVEAIKGSPTVQDQTKGAPQAKQRRGAARVAPGSAPAGATTAPGNEAPQGAPVGLEGTTDGSLSEWAYQQFGVIGVSSRLWTSPEIPEPPQGQPKPPGEGETRWLFWNDRVMEGQAFAPFVPFEHPTLGKVEVGGWKPGVRLNPPIEQVEAIADGQFAFLKEFARKLPSLAIANVKVAAKGGGIFEVSASVENNGYLPTALAQGIKTRKADPVLVRLKVDKAKILAGNALNRVNSLAGSGGRQEFRWLILAPEGVKSVVLQASTPKAGSASKTIDLK